MSPHDKPLVWLRGKVRTPPLSPEARVTAGFLLRRLQQGESIGMPHSRPLPSLGRACHELRVRDRGKDWRIIYRVGPDAIVILEVFQKKTQRTPQTVLDEARKRLRDYDLASKERPH